MINKDKVLDAVISEVYFDETEINQQLEKVKSTIKGYEWLKGELLLMLTPAGDASNTVRVAIDRTITRIDEIIKNISLQIINLSSETPIKLEEFHSQIHVQEAKKKLAKIKNHPWGITDARIPEWIYFLNTWSVAFETTGLLQDDYFYSQTSRNIRIENKPSPLDTFEDNTDSYFDIFNHFNK